MMSLVFSTNEDLAFRASQEQVDTMHVTLAVQPTIPGPLNARKQSVHVLFLASCILHPSYVYIPLAPRTDWHALGYK